MPTTTITKRCARCAHSLPHSSFGPNRSRPPLFLQGNCRACSVKAMRDSRGPATWEADLENIIAGVNALAVAEVRGEGHVLALPALRGRGRVRRKHMARPNEALHNWLDLIDGRRTGKPAPAGLV